MERIIKVRREGRRKYFLVKWKGFDHSHNTWEPAANLDSTLIKQFK